MPIESHEDARGAPRPRSRWLRRAAWAGAALLLLVVAAYLGVPPLARHLLVVKASEALRRPVTVGDISFNPFKLTLTIGGLVIGERDGSDEFFAFDEVFADAQAVSVFYRAPVLREFRVRGPRIRVVREADGRTYNFSDLLGEKEGSAESKDPEDKPMRFALHNIRVSGGLIDFEDRPVGVRHRVTGLEVTIPFISNFPARVDTFEQPTLFALVDGAPFRLDGRTKPFKDTLETVVDLAIEGVDVPRYLAYLPADLGFRVREGTLGTRLSVSFSESRQGRALFVRGTARLDRMAIEDRGGAPLLSLDSLEVSEVSADILGRRLAVGRVLLSAPEATVARSRTGGLNWSAVIPAPVPGGETPASPEPSPSWEVAVAEARIAGGKLHWRDETVAGGFDAEFEEIEAAMRPVAFPQREPAEVELRLRTGFGESLDQRGTLRYSPLEWRAQVDVRGVRPRSWKAYYDHLTEYEVREGLLRASASVSLDRGEGGAIFGFKGLDAGLDGLRVRRRGEPADLLELGSAEVAGCSLDVPARHLDLGTVVLGKGILQVLRDASGRIGPGVPIPAPTADEAIPSGEASESVGESVGEPSTSPATPAEEGAGKVPESEAEEPWLVGARSIRLEGWRTTLVDQAVPGGATHTVDPLSLEIADLSTGEGSRGSVRLAAGINGEGRFSARGEFGLKPLQARLDLDLKALSLVPWYPYYAGRVNFVTGSGDVSLKGSLTVAPAAKGSAAADFRGDAAVTDFSSVDRLNAEDMLTWKSLSLGGISLEVSPFSLDISEIVLSEFYSRLIIFPDGRFNVQRAVAGQEGGQSGVEPGEAPAESGGEPEGEPATAEAEQPPPGEEPSPETKPRPPVAVRHVTLQGGTVSFSDRFVKPNYSAVLTDLAGAVTDLSSRAGTAGDVEVRGRLGGSAPLAITGKINPLAGNLFLDVKAQVRDIEMGPFSPYSGKFLGYGIEKGKLNFDVAYRVENRKLAAENRLVLDQFTFGEKVDSPKATSLPVRLAVALLKDRHGVIDVNLPISGSLDDPKFRVGRIILQIILNIIVKAVTSPFALLGSLFGGGEELSFAPYEAGAEEPLPAGRTRIEALRTALYERPGLSLEISGRADPESDRERLRRRRFEQQLKAAKLRDIVRQGTAAPSLDLVVIEAAEYEKYLRRAYRDAKFPRPRNFLGMLKDLPLADVENLMLTNTPVTDDDLVVLANRRAEVAKEILTEGDKGVAPERIYLVAPVIESPAPEGGRPPARVEFTLR